MVPIRTGPVNAYTQLSDERLRNGIAAGCGSAVKSHPMNEATENELTAAIAFLRDAKWTDKEIGDEVGTDKSSVSRMSRGLRDPAFSVGFRIYALAQRVKKNPKLVPASRN